MTDLAIQPEFVDKLLDGSKPFTLRRAWKNGRTPGNGAKIRFVVNPRRPDRRVVGTGLVILRATVTFDERGLCGGGRIYRPGSILGMPLSLDLLALLIKGNKREEDPVRAAEASEEFARMDGFADYPAFWAFHNRHRKPDAGPCERELIAFGAITQEFAP